MDRVEIVERTADRALVSLEDVKAFLGVSGTSEDAELSGLILAASVLVAGVDGLGRDPWRQKYQERIAGQGSLDLFLAHWPIESVDEVTEGGSAVGLGAFEISGSERRRLYRLSGCWRRDSFDVQARGGPQQAHGIVATYRAGWVPPSQISEWSADTTYTTGQLVLPANASGLMFEVTTTGVGGTSEPTWPVTEGETVADGTADLIARPDLTVPDDVERGLLILVQQLRDSAPAAAAGVRVDAFDGARTEYFEHATAQPLPLFMQSLLRSYR